MIPPEEYDDIIVTVGHPWANSYPTLTQWIATGPQKDYRPLVGLIGAKRKSTGERVPLREIPLEFHNSPKSRHLQRLGQLPTPWGPPAEDATPYVEPPEHIRRLLDDE